jgi:hypothetical protein
VAIDSGAMVRRVVMGLQLGTEHSKVAPPAELRFPLLAPGLDSEYAAALHAVVVRPTDASRRLGSAIDWLDLAWRNSTSITEEMRVLALRSGLEVLLDVGDREADMRAALASLLPHLRGRRRSRHWTTLRGSPRSESMSDLEWWFLKFSRLRNAIVHGSMIRPGDHRYGRTRHLWLAERYLRAAIKEIVARTGFPLVRLDAFQRVAHRVQLGG